MLRASCLRACFLSDRAVLLTSEALWVSSERPVAASYAGWRAEGFQLIMEAERTTLRDDRQCPGVNVLCALRVARGFEETALTNVNELFHVWSLLKLPAALRQNPLCCTSFCICCGSAWRSLGTALILPPGTWLGREMYLLGICRWWQFILSPKCSVKGLSVSLVQ